ncbi:MAG: hypothetical protein WD072_00245 [Pirellulales bacterium]
MIHQPKPESIIEELHRIRREISDRFGGDVALIAKDAADRLAKSGRPIWTPHPETPASQGPGDRNQSTASPATEHR